MAPYRQSLTRRDAILLLLGATIMHLLTTAFGPWSGENTSAVINTYIENPVPPPAINVPVVEQGEHRVVGNNPVHEEEVPAPPPPKPSAPPQELESDSDEPLPETILEHHAPGWTIFRNLYMSGGTLYIVSSQPRSSFPEIRMMTSTGLAAENTPENIQLREPTAEDMDFLTPSEAKSRWEDGKKILKVEGNTFLVNEPSQFLRHYYHFVAEYLFGAWIFWTGAFSSAPAIPKVDRVIFANSNADGWRDNPGFNAYFFRAAFPSVTVEHEEDWLDRAVITKDGDRAWRFPLVLFEDRSAAFRGESCGSRTQRIASEALEKMEKENRLPIGWWEPVRQKVMAFAGGRDYAMPGTGSKDVLPDPEKIVITYISRQSARRRLIPENHALLVDELERLTKRRGWEFNLVQAEHITKDEQVQLASKTTILLGVHGNGLTHLVLMRPTKVSAVIEMFFPGGFAHDYEWTTRALGMKHFAVRNDTHQSYPNEPQVDYPDGFQGNSIPVYGPMVAKLIEDRIDGKL